MSRKKKKTVWRLWAKALGEKAGKNDKESDLIASIRTIVFLTYLITNIAIVANAIRHWNDIDYTQNSDYNKNERVNDQPERQLQSN